MAGPSVTSTAKVPLIRTADQFAATIGHFGAEMVITAQLVNLVTEEQSTAWGEISPASGIVGNLRDMPGPQVGIPLTAILDSGGGGEAPAQFSFASFAYDSPLETGAVTLDALLPIDFITYTGDPELWYLVFYGEVDTVSVGYVQGFIYRQPNGQRAALLSMRLTPAFGSPYVKTFCAPTSFLLTADIGGGVIATFYNVDVNRVTEVYGSARDVNVAPSKIRSINNNLVWFYADSNNYLKFAKMRNDEFIAATVVTYPVSFDHTGHFAEQSATIASVYDRDDYVYIMSQEKTPAYPTGDSIHLVVTEFNLDTMTGERKVDVNGLIASWNESEEPDTIDPAGDAIAHQYNLVNNTDIVGGGNDYALAAFRRNGYRHQVLMVVNFKTSQWTTLRRRDTGYTSLHGSSEFAQATVIDGVGYLLGTMVQRINMEALTYAEQTPGVGFPSTSEHGPYLEDTDLTAGPDYAIAIMGAEKHREAFQAAGARGSTTVLQKT